MGTLIFKTAAVSAAALIHQLLLSNIIRSPQGFFDTTPLGRILARFSSDTITVDSTIPDLFDMMMRTALTVIFMQKNLKCERYLFVQMTTAITLSNFCVGNGGFCLGDWSQELLNVKIKCSKPKFHEPGSRTLGSKNL